MRVMRVALAAGCIAAVAGAIVLSRQESPRGARPGERHAAVRVDIAASGAIAVTGVDGTVRKAGPVPGGGEAARRSLGEAMASALVGAAGFADPDARPPSPVRLDVVAPDTTRWERVLEVLVAARRTGVHVPEVRLSADGEAWQTIALRAPEAHVPQEDAPSGTPLKDAPFGRPLKPDTFWHPDTLPPEDMPDPPEDDGQPYAPTLKVSLFQEDAADASPGWTWIRFADEAKPTPFAPPPDPYGAARDRVRSLLAQFPDLACEIEMPLGNGMIVPFGSVLRTLGALRGFLRIELRLP